MMDNGLIARLNAGVALPRVDPLVTRQITRTELPPSSAVLALDSSEAVRLGLSRQAQAISLIENEVQVRTVTLDQDSRELVFQSRDARTGEVIRQVPDEVLLRLRIYARLAAEQHGSGREDGKSARTV